MKLFTVILFTIAAGLYFWFLKQLSWQFHIGLIAGVVGTEVYYWDKIKSVGNRNARSAGTARDITLK